MRMETIWKPNVVVAAVVESDGRFLLVEEETAEGLRLNQPAGHLDEGESLFDAVMRETLEETAYRIVPRRLLGVYQWRRPQGDITYIRFAFSGAIVGFDENRTLDEGIVRAVWMTPAELASCPERHRSPLVLRAVQDYLSGRNFPLEFITHWE